MKTIKLILSAVFLATLMLSCEKEGPPGPAGVNGEQGPRGETGANGPKGDKGATGPKGATGATGPKGDKGATGTQGPKGDKGTANVIYSEWEAIQFGGGTISKVMNIGISELDASVLAHGSLLVYVRTPITSITAIPLPYTYIVSSQPKTLLTYRYTDNILQLVAYRVDPNSTIYNFPGSLWQYRYVIIPGGIPSSTALKNVNLKDYNAVAKAMYIPG